MAGKRPYKTWTLDELEAEHTSRLAVKQRIPAALKEALEAARLADTLADNEQFEHDRRHVEVPDEFDDGQVEPAEPVAALDAAAKEARFTEALLGVMAGTTSVDEAVADLTGEQPEPDRLAADMDAEQARETAAEIKARRTEFGKRVDKLMTGGFTRDQAVEALTSEFPQEAAEYRTAMEQAPQQPPERRPEDVDQSTGELLVDRKPEPGSVTTEQMDQMVAEHEANRVDKTPDQLEPPYARVSAEPRPVTYYWASIKIVTPQPDGSDTIETVSCQCPYGHEREDLAVKHAKKLAAERGLNVVA